MVRFGNAAAQDMVGIPFSHAAHETRPDACGSGLWLIRAVLPRYSRFSFSPLRAIVCMSFPSALMSAEERLFISRMRVSIASKCGIRGRKRKTNNRPCSLSWAETFGVFPFHLCFNFRSSKLTVNAKLLRWSFFPHLFTSYKKKLNDSIHIPDITRLNL